MSAIRRSDWKLVLCSLMLAGCGDPLDGYEQSVKSARIAIPAAVEMEELLGDVDHFIEQYGLKSPNANRWDTVAYFGGRYMLTMQAPISVDYQLHKLAVTGELYFQLNEVTKVIVHPDGTPETRYGEQFVFTEKEWNRLRENRGDFSSIGIKLNPTPVPDFDEAKRAWSRDIIRVSLLKDK